MAAPYNTAQVHHTAKANDVEAGQQAKPILNAGSIPQYGYMSLGQIMTSKFMLLQLIVNVGASFAVPGIGFSVVIPYKGPYTVGSSNIIGPILAGPFACAILCSLFLPFGMPDAMARGWYGALKPSCVTDGLQRAMPWMRLRYGVLRSLVMGTLTAAILIPAALLFCRFYWDNRIHHAAQLWFCTLYIALAPMIIIPFALVSFAIEPNLQRMLELAGPQKTILNRALNSPLC